MIIRIGDIACTPQEWLGIHDSELSGLALDTKKILSKWFNNDRTFSLETSGSTGEPTTFVLGLDMLKWSCNNTRQYMGLTKEKVFCCLPLNKAGGFMMLIRALYFDWNIEIVAPSANPLENYKGEATFISLVPYQLQNILDQADGTKKLEGFTHILIGGAELTAALTKKVRNMTARIYHGYGMTETASHVALREIGANEKGFDILSGVDISIEDDQPIRIKIPAFNIDLRTKDYGRLENNKLIFLGREQGFINSGGVKILSSQIETTIQTFFVEHKLDYEVVVLPINDDKFGEVLCAVSNKALSEDIKMNLNSFLQLKMSKHHQIKHWEVIAAFPRVNFKIDKRLLAQQIATK